MKLCLAICNWGSHSVQCLDLTPSESNKTFPAMTHVGYYGVDDEAGDDAKHFNAPRSIATARLMLPGSDAPTRCVALLEEGGNRVRVVKESCWTDVVGVIDLRKDASESDLSGAHGLQIISVCPDDDAAASASPLPEPQAIVTFTGSRLVRRYNLLTGKLEAELSWPPLDEESGGNKAQHTEGAGSSPATTCGPSDGYDDYEQVALQVPGKSAAPGAIAVFPSRDRLLVADAGTDRCLVLDAATLAVVDAWPGLRSKVLSLAMLTDGTVAMAHAQAFISFRTLEGKPLSEHKTEVAYSSLAEAPDETGGQRILCITNVGEEVDLFDRAVGRVVRCFAIDPETCSPRGMAVVLAPE